ncbi:thioredoxin family protein [Penaeicola halotolerans]|uniref:thioredoxin family protein n=1 Tax=Penaeicola halotolerans TaxID=2793196 RepID=UPI001CF8C716|nr:thioredoxin family protein [Penaeicola halotolerans]
MKKIFTFITAFLMVGTMAMAQYQVGDYATDFKLKNIDGKYVSLADNPNNKGYLVIFTCNHCPYSKMYEDRIIALDKKYKAMGYPVVAINPNDPEAQPEDSFENMKIRAKEKGFTFPYLVDETQEITKTYGATRTPHVFLLTKERDRYKVAYIGAIDNNHQDASKATERYVEMAMTDVMAGKSVRQNFTKAIGCTIKWKAED